MKTFIYVLKLIPRLFDEHAWTNEDNACIESHFLRLKNDFEKGIILHVGRTEETKDQGFGIVIFYAQNLEEANQYADSDPAVFGNIMTVTCQPYKVIFK